jgi:hypothetical protein
MEQQLMRLIETGFFIQEADGSISDGLPADLDELLNG